jgi:hypothetical protein
LKNYRAGGVDGAALPLKPAIIGLKQIVSYATFGRYARALL